MNELGLRLLAIIALVVANAFFVAAEFALVASRRTRIEAMIRRGDGKARTVRRALRDLYRLLSATQLGITLTSILLGFVAEDTVAHFFRDWFAALPPSLSFLARGGIASVVAVGTISFLHVVFGELVPKTWAITYPEATSRWVAGPLMVFSWITRPFNFLLNASARLILRLIGIKSSSPELDRVHSPEEIRMLVEQSRQTGGLGAGDARMLEGVFEFSEKNAREVMTPRTAIVALPAEASLAEAADRVAAAGRSRYPVTGESLDDVVGIVHAKDILRGLLSGSEAPVQDIARSAFFVPGTREVEDVLADMKRQKVHLAIVLDEFGGTAGLVTMEDLLEEIVGPIYDEYDQAPATAAAGVAGGAGSGEGGVPIVAGSTEIGEVNRLVRLHLDDADYTTIGGLIFGQLGRLPKVGDRVNLQGATFEILEMDGRRVGRVRVWPATATQVPEPTG
ncbi:MAG TPA: hemolysin family protein [Gemmatimonadales bacterium]|nr:hemolysin family protein [Gemmatimonadales bacterium]